MRSRSLRDHELQSLLEPAASGGADLRAQVAVALLGEAGISPRELARMSTATALRVRFDPAPTLPSQRLVLLDQMLERTGERPYLLGGERPLAPAGLRWICRRFGERRSVPGVTPERLRRTWLRRVADEHGVAEAARRAGVSQDTVRRQLRAEEPVEPATPRPLSPTPTVVRVQLSGARAAGVSVRMD